MLDNFDYGMAASNLRQRYSVSIRQVTEVWFYVENSRFITLRCFRDPLEGPGINDAAKGF